jgi:hypothetical protein
MQASRLARSIVVASVSSAFLVVLGAVAMVGQAWFGLHAFGGEAYIPRVIALEVPRAWAAWGAAVVACFFVTALQHADAELARNRWRFALLAALATPALYAPVGALALGVSATLTRALVGSPPRALFGAIETIDVLAGALNAVILSCVPAGWSFFAAPLTRTPARGLGSKLFFTWLLVVAIAFADHVAARLLAR